MSADGAFISAILDEPADDNVRLVFADWLDEHGQEARAEFIRVQIELTRLGDPHQQPIPGTDRPAHIVDATPCRWYAVLGPCPWCSRRTRAEDLFCANRRDWPPVPLDDHNFSWYQRGFVTRVEPTVEEWEEHGTALLAAHPLEHIFLPHVGAVIVRGIADRPWLVTYYRRRGANPNGYTTKTWPTRAEMVIGVLYDTCALETAFA